jgi:TonB family protein
MSYQALLFCPDERTARTVTQVLSELEFNVEPCTEPFAAVKKLMGQHFDAVVVDCDNEQNATLLFKSARNSASNQASLAVAVVEGQAGVAKAFRIGANLVLTKPINIEQAKGTLRVARGLLRKGEPVKPGAPASPVAAVVPTTPTKPAPRLVPSAALTPRPIVKTAPSPAPAHSAATANSTVSAHDKALPQTKPIPTAKEETPVAPPLPATAPPPVAKPLAVAESKPVFKSAAPAAPSFGGAASAPAPALEAHAAEIVEAPSSSATADAHFDKPAVAEASGASTSTVPEPSFTFGGNVGGANAAESGGGVKKIALGVAAVVLVAVGAYAGWTYYQGHQSHSASSVPTPISVPAVKPKPVAPPAAVPATSAAAPASQPADDTISASATPAESAAAGNTDSNAAADDSSAPAPVSKKTSSPASVSKTVSKTAPDSKSAAPPEAAPALVVKGGAVPKKPKTDVADAPAPSMIGIAESGANAPPPSLLNGENNAPKPVLQTLNVSQGVSQGLLYKKIQPIYPTQALSMRIEGPVELMATIAKTGDITAVKVLSGDAQLAKAAVNAVKQWKYKPYLLNGEPVEIQTQVTINFRLPN